MNAQAKLPWWKKPAIVHALVDQADLLDRRYAGRPLVAVGHSPSWLVYTAGALRTARGQDRAVTFIPFTGAYLDMPREKLFQPLDEKRRISFEGSEYVRASDKALQTYFNYLSRRGVDPLQMQNRYGADNKPVFIDFLFKGKGLVSFLHAYDRMARAQGLAGLTGDVHTYKLAMPEGAYEFALPAGAPDQDKSGSNKLCVPFNLTSGTAAVLLNELSGASGLPAAWELEGAHSREGNRFMPYYTVTDGYTDSPLYKNATPPPSGLRRAPANGATVRAIKAAIRDAVAHAVADPAAHQALAQQGHQDLLLQAPRAVNPETRWMPMFRGYH